jgi:hypothetical protein
VCVLSVKLQCSCLALMKKMDFSLLQYRCGLSGTCRHSVSINKTCNRSSSLGSLLLIAGNLSVSVEDLKQMWTEYRHKSPTNRNTTQGSRSSCLIDEIINSGTLITGRVV